MGIVLSPETERIIQDAMKRHGYSRAGDIVRAGLVLLEQQAAIGDFAPGELDRLIAEAEAEFSRGEGMNADAVFAEIEQMARRFPGKPEAT
jgi:Arc/MetJ-type ribon-helix-helix transcriptional regulator